MKRALFWLSYVDRREFEWAWPYMTALKEAGVEVEVLVPSPEQTKRQRLVRQLVITSGFRATYVDEICVEDRLIAKPLYRIGALIQGRYQWYYQILKQLTIPTSHLQRHIGFSWKLSRTRLRTHLEKSDGLFVSQSCERNASPGSLSSELLTLAVETKKLIAKYPLSAKEVMNEPKSTPALIIRPACHLENTPVKTIPTGIIRYNYDWIKRIAELTHASKDIEIPENNKKVTLLYGLKNRTGTISRIVSFNDHMEVRRRTLSKLIDQGYFPIIKPHPGISEAEMSSWLSGFDKASYAVSQLPLSKLVQFVDGTVFELVSSGIFDVIAAGQAAFWPEDIWVETAHIESRDHFKESLIRSGVPPIYFDFLTSGLPKAGESLLVDEATHSHFQTSLHVPPDLCEAFEPVKRLSHTFRENQQHV